MIGRDMWFLLEMMEVEEVVKMAQQAANDMSKLSTGQALLHRSIEKLREIDTWPDGLPRIHGPLTDDYEPDFESIAEGLEFDEND